MKNLEENERILSLLRDLVSRPDCVLSFDADLIDYFLDDALVAAVPGNAFGLSPAFRVSYATSEAVLVEACTRIQRACSALK